MLNKISFLIVLFCVFNQLSAQKSHPFLIITENQFSELRDKSSLEPFASIKENALETWNTDFEHGNWHKMATILSQNTLLYALDTNKKHRKAYLKKILVILDTWENFKVKPDHGHSGIVDMSGALFNSIIALDMVHSDLTKEELHKAENLLDLPYRFFLKNRLPDNNHIWWALCRLGILSTYNIYHQDQANATLWSERYRHYLMKISMSDDGSWVQSPGYSHARIAGRRIAKSGPMDVIQANDYFHFYESGQMKNFVAWMNVFSMTPFAAVTRFGESGLTTPHADSHQLYYLSNRYSEISGQNAAWHFRNIQHGSQAYSNDFINFCLQPIESPEPKMPKSLLMKNSGASLWGKDGGSEALQGVLYSPKRDNWEMGSFGHASEDVNSIGIQGYGEYLIANAGTNYKPSYPGLTPDGDRWYEAWMQNVVLVGKNNRHLNRSEGGGLVDGIIGNTIEFGTTDSRGSIENALHYRTLAMVHEKEARNNGYFVLADEVELKFIKDSVYVLLQLNSRLNSVQTINEGREYLAPINGFTQDDSDGSEKLTVFYAIRPADVKLKKAWKGDLIREDFENDRLEASYVADEYGVARGLTILFPQDATRKKSDLKNIQGTNCWGVKVTHNKTGHDIILGSNGEKLAFYNDVAFNAKTAILQYENTKLKDWLLIQTRRFKVGSEIDFNSDKPVSMYGRNDGEIVINAIQETKIVFNSPSKGFVLDGNKIEDSVNNENSKTIVLSKGKHTIRLKAASN